MVVLGIILLVLGISGILYLLFNRKNLKEFPRDEEGKEIPLKKKNARNMSILAVSLILLVLGIIFLIMAKKNGKPRSSTSGKESELFASASTTTPEPATPEPTTPESTTPEPATSEPTTPEPTTPEPTTLEPTTSEPTTPEPATPEPTTPEPTTPEPTTPEPTTPEPTTPEPTTPEPTTVKPTRPSGEVVELSKLVYEAFSDVMNGSNGVWRTPEEEKLPFDREAAVKLLTPFLGYTPDSKQASFGEWSRNQLTYLFDVANNWYAGNYTIDEAYELLKACPAEKDPNAPDYYGKNYVTEADIAIVEYDGYETEFTITKEGPFGPELLENEVELDLSFWFILKRPNTQGKTVASSVSGHYNGVRARFLYVKVNYDAERDKTIVYYCAAANSMF